MPTRSKIENEDEDDDEDDWRGAYTALNTYPKAFGAMEFGHFGKVFSSRHGRKARPFALRPEGPRELSPGRQGAPKRSDGGLG